MEKNSVNNKVERPQNKHLKPFKKGECGNPDGRPLGQRNYATIYREALIKLGKLNNKTPEELEEEILSKGLLNARSGDYRFYKDILDRLYGTPVSRTELTGKDGQDLFPDKDTIDKTDEALKDYINGNRANTKTEKP